MKIEHQFLQEQFFIPDWEIKYLFLGTFNPACGEKVNYFYGRESNFTWKILTEIFKIKLTPFREDELDIFFKNLILKKIACMDIIENVSFNESTFDKTRICGKGYKDTNIINNKTKRNYNTNDILSIIQKNKDIKVFSTWGKGSNLKEWRNEIEKIDKIINLKSPSRAARVPKGSEKFNYILEDWKSKILL